MPRVRCFFDQGLMGPGHVLRSEIRWQLPGLLAAFGSELPGGEGEGRLEGKPLGRARGGGLKSGGTAMGDLPHLPSVSTKSE